MENNVETDKLQLLAELIRRNSAEVKLTETQDLLEEPLSLDMEEVKAKVEELQKDEDYADIKIIRSGNKPYFFSNKFMTKNYAVLLAHILEKDLLSMIAETVREEAKIYPRPTDIRLFSRGPFFLSHEEVNETLKQIKNRIDFADIKEVKASNGALYLYSEKFMNNTYAKSLAELVEVIQPENP